MLLEPKWPLKAGNRGGLGYLALLEACIWDALVERLEGKVEMGIDTMHIVDTMRGLGIAHVVQVSAPS